MEAVKGLCWKLAERFGVQAVQLAFQILLARLLEPAQFGALAIWAAFAAIAHIWVQGGLHTALVQKEKADSKDFSAAFWSVLAAAGAVYLVLFCAAPWLASFCGISNGTAPFRVYMLMVFPGAVQSVLLAITGRRLRFRPVFFSGISAVVVSGAVGLWLAVRGLGLWALVAQSLVFAALSCGLLWLFLRWKPLLSCEMQRVRTMFSFGWKLQISGLLDTAYQALYSFVIGQKYSAAELGFYSRGRQLPQLLAVGAGDGLRSILLPVLSAKQRDGGALKRAVRRAVRLSAWAAFLLMAALAGAAEPLVRLLLTDKWLPCVPFLRIFCFSFALYPVCVCHLQAINALGRSDVFLKLELIKKAVGTAVLLAAAVWLRSAVSLALTGAAVSLFGCAVNGLASRKLFGYTCKEQLCDLLPAVCAALLLCGAVVVVCKIGG